LEKIVRININNSNIITKVREDRWCRIKEININKRKVHLLLSGTTTRTTIIISLMVSNINKFNSNLHHKLVHWRQVHWRSNGKIITSHIVLTKILIMNWQINCQWKIHLLSLRVIPHHQHPNLDKTCQRQAYLKAMEITPEIICWEVKIIGKWLWWTIIQWQWPTWIEEKWLQTMKNFKKMEDLAIKMLVVETAQRVSNNFNTEFTKNWNNFNRTNPKNSHNLLTNLSHNVLYKKSSTKNKNQTAKSNITTP